MNCRTETGDPKFFLNVLLCEDCAIRAKTLRNRGKSELENVLATLDTVFRAALTGAGLELDERELSSDEVLTYLLALNRHWRKTDPPHAA
jgi:hypothetical protein